MPASSTTRPTPSTISTMAQLSQHLQQANNPKSNTVTLSTTTATVLPSRSGQVNYAVFSHKYYGTVYIKGAYTSAFMEYWGRA